ncbi:MAG: T9SS type A sorting domain-containing protein [Bacteroidetes bacterium]|nr:T9SS type A sorting domain-containing protein [Bacteroidota bacterium]
MKSRLTMFLLLTLLITQNLRAQWVQTNGPEGGRVNCITRVGSDIWAGTYGGIFISQDEGLTWQKSPLYDNVFVGEIFSSGDTLVVRYALPDTDYVEYGFLHEAASSFNGGITWNSAVYLSADTGTGTYNFQRCQSGLLLNSNHFVCYISDDMGLSWHSPGFPSGINNGGVISDLHRLLLVSAFDFDSVLLFLSGDLGQTWQALGVTGDARGWFISDSLILYITYDSLIIRSDDLGNTWDTILCPPIPYLAFFMTVGDSIFGYNYYNALIYSADQGLTWQTGLLPPDFFWTSLELNNGDILHSEGFQLSRYIPSLGISIPANSGLKCRKVNCIRNFNDFLFCSTAEGIFRSADAGQTWLKVYQLPYPDTFIDNSIFDIEATHDTIFWVNPGNFGRSFDNGLTWQTTVLPALSNDHFITSIEMKGSRIYLSANTLWQSDDWGQTWQNMPGLPYITTPGPGNFSQTGYLKLHKNKLFAISRSGYIFYYDELAGQWIYSFNILSDQLLYDNVLFSLDSTLIATGEQALCYSQDTGNTWVIPAGNGLPTGAMAPVYPESMTSFQGLWIGCNPYTGIYCTSDYGNNWSLYQGGVSNLKARNLTEMNGILYCGSLNSSVWRYNGSLFSISGRVFRDDNNNGLFDPGEEGISNISILSDATGDTLRPVFPVGGVSVTPDHYITNAGGLNQDFAAVPVPGIRDLSIDLTNINVFRPGFNTLINLHVMNKGSVVQTPVVTLVKDADLLYQSATPVPNSVNGDTLTWQLDSLHFLGNFNIQLDVITSLSISYNDTLICSATVFPLIGDTNPSDNHSTLIKNAVGSYDPNDKTCEQGSFLSPINLSHGKELPYTIRFQNLGNFPTDFVHIIDTLSPYLDWGSFRLISSSHPVQLQWLDRGVVEFIFDPLVLQPAGMNEMASIGFVKYAIKGRKEILVGTWITNQAHIYFDLNLPVQTNKTFTLVAEAILSIDRNPGQPDDPVRIRIFPNPANNELTVHVEGNMTESLNVVIFDIAGRKLLQIPVNQENTIIPVTAISAGFYFGSLVSGKGRKIGSFKFIVNH